MSGTHSATASGTHRDAFEAVSLKGAWLTGESASETAGTRLRPAGDLGRSASPRPRPRRGRDGTRTHSTPGDTPAVSDLFDARPSETMRVQAEAGS
jgi:hypothetical protein